MEHAIKELEKQIRTLHIQLAIDGGCTQEQLNPKGDFMTWLVREAGWDLTHYQKKADGKTAFERLMQKEYRGTVVKILEAVWCKIPEKTSYRQVGR